MITLTSHTEPGSAYWHSNYLDIIPFSLSSQFRPRVEQYDVALCWVSDAFFFNKSCLQHPPLLFTLLSKLTRQHKYRLKSDWTKKKNTDLNSTWLYGRAREFVSLSCLYFTQVLHPNEPGEENEAFLHFTIIITVTHALVKYRIITWVSK